jgi:hypothetical protein
MNSIFEQLADWKDFERLCAGMHPTADTPPLMLREWCGAAGDAER